MGSTPVELDKPDMFANLADEKEDDWDRKDGTIHASAGQPLSLDLEVDKKCKMSGHDKILKQIMEHPGAKMWHPRQISIKFFCTATSCAACARLRCSDIWVLMVLGAHPMYIQPTVN